MRQASSVGFGRRVNRSPFGAWRLKNSPDAWEKPVPFVNKKDCCAFTGRVGKNNLLHWLRMDYQEGKERFIEVWGRMASGWGIPPAMARVHALLLASSKPLSLEDIVRQLDISVGSASTNLRELLEWKLIHKRPMAGERREYFEAERDLWAIVRQIILHRKKKELEPVIEELNQLKQVNACCPESEAFKRFIEEMSDFSQKVNCALKSLTEGDHMRALRLMILTQSSQ